MWYKWTTPTSISGSGSLYKVLSIKKRKYSSYKGRIGKIVDNHIKRNFEVIENYIYYYNNKRIKEKLKGLTPASYRSKSLLVS